MVQVTRNAKVTIIKAISNAEVTGTKGQERHRLVDCYLDELLARINDFFGSCPDELKADLYREYWTVCRTRLGVRE